MELKGSVKSNRIRSSIKSKKSFIPKVEVVTENVFVPIIKTVFTKKCGDAIQCNSSVPKVELVKFYQCNNGTKMALLKKSYLQEKRYANSILYPKQTNIINKHKKVMLSGKSHSINKSYSFINNQKENIPRRSENKKQQILIFPSSISDLPLTSFKCQSPSMDENIIRSNNWKKKDKINEKETIDSINRISANLPKTYYNDTKLSANEKIQISEKNILNNSIMFNNTSNISIALRSAAITASRQKEKDEKQSILDPYRGSILNDIDIRGIISNDVINYDEELKYPIKRIESKPFNQVQCTMFDFSTSDKFSETNRNNTIETTHSKILATRNFHNHSLENINYSILSFLTKNQPQYQDCANLQKNNHVCRIKYSWQVIGTGSQTSKTLLNSLVEENNLSDGESVYNCSVKYSWQIIGIATQTSQRDFTISEYQSAMSFLSARTNIIRRFAKETLCDSLPVTVWRKGKRFIVLNNQYTQTFTHKECQTIFTELYKKHDD
ncbi:hypothetical protein WN51_06577 [Melipona quadrifasciata]|uniref:Uncharacterized protein n=1 Tax=Melipona quadrifasciata TaxID=166423 RepID=A0A0M8ZTT7_9HYME|nr:hypothetical protein WN51_06577 [Melipona quadrifasciata]